MAHYRFLVSSIPNFDHSAIIAVISVLKVLPPRVHSYSTRIQKECGRFCGGRN